MNLNMYLGEVQSQTQSMNAVCTATIQGMEQAIQSIDAFAIDTVLQGQTYSSAKSFFVQTFRPLAQGIIYLCEELIRQNDAFPNQFQSKVASTDVIEQELLEQIQEIDRMKTSMEAVSQAMPIPGMDAMANLFTAMRHKLQEKLDHLHEFNQTSSNNYSTAIQLASSIATGLAEVQSGKGFSPASGTFSTQGLNMEWTTSIQAIEEDRKRQSENLLKSSSIEEGAMCGPLSSEGEGFDGKKLARDVAGEMTGEYDIRRAWEGIDPSTGDKLLWLDRVSAGGMMVLGVTPVGKLAKMVKGVKMTADAAQAAKKAAKAAENYKDHLERQDKLLTSNGAYRKARREAGIPNSTPRQKPTPVYDGTSEHRLVEEYTNIKNEKVYIIEHREDKMGRGPHFHTADAEKGSPLEKGRYNQHPGHYPEDIEGYKKKGKK